MVKEKLKIFQCKECKMFYKDKKLAKKCEEWCRKHKSCNIEIIKHSINLQWGKQKLK